MATRPPPSARSRAWSARTRARCGVRTAATTVGSTVAGLPALPRPHQHLTPGEIDVLHPQLQPVHQAEPRAVAQLADQLVGGRRRPGCAEDGVHLGAREHGRQARRALRAGDAVEAGQRRLEHDAVQEHQRRPRLVLRGRAHPVPGGEVGEERLDRGDVERGRMPVTAEVDEAPHPGHVGLLGAWAVVPHPDGGPKPREQAWSRGGRRRGMARGWEPGAERIAWRAGALHRCVARWPGPLQATWSHVAPLPRTARCRATVPRRPGTRSRDVHRSMMARVIRTRPRAVCTGGVRRDTPCRMRRSNRPGSGRATTG